MIHYQRIILLLLLLTQLIAGCSRRVDRFSGEIWFEEVVELPGNQAERQVRVFVSIQEGPSNQGYRFPDDEAHVEFNGRNLDRTEEEGWYSDAGIGFNPNEPAFNLIIETAGSSLGSFSSIRRDYYWPSVTIPEVPEVGASLSFAFPDFVDTLRVRAFLSTGEVLFDLEKHRIGSNREPIQLELTAVQPGDVLALEVSYSVYDWNGRMEAGDVGVVTPCYRHKIHAHSLIIESGQALSGGRK